MNALINACIQRSKTIYAIITVLLIAGTMSYVAIPKEAQPEIKLPIIFINLIHEGISPEDAERLLVRPLEIQLRNIEGVDKMTATAFEGGASVRLEFDPSIDTEAALNDVREKVDLARSSFPEDTMEPRIQAVNLSDQASIVVSLSGPVPERTMNRLADNLKDDLETIPAVLEANITGMREDLLEVVIDPLKLELYGLSQNDLLNAVLRNNRLVAAGTLDNGQGRFSIKVPGLVEDVNDALDIPVKYTKDAVVTLGDVSQVRRTFKDVTSLSRVDGQPAISIEVVKRNGTNTIDLSDDVRAVVAEHQKTWPAGVAVAYPTDLATNVKVSISNLRNSVITAILLVAIVVVAALGGRSALLVGLSIPTSFLATFLILHMMGASLNNVALFGLVLSVGMLVDGAIVVVEYADRKMLEGLNRREAYRRAAQRMAWPIISSTATTLAAFLPLIFWPGILGQFMSKLPITLLIVLCASLVTALIFLPVMGAAIGKPSEANADALKHLRAAEDGDVRQLSGSIGWYARLVSACVDRPIRVVLGGITTMVAIMAVYGAIGGGVNIFPDQEPDNIPVSVRARGNLSVEERDALVREVERVALRIPDAKNVYARVNAGAGGGGWGGGNRDEIGRVNIDLKDWTERRPSDQIESEIRAETSQLAGIIAEPQIQGFNPEGGKSISIEVSSRFPDRILPVATKIRDYMTHDVSGLEDVSDSLPLPGIEWALHVDRAEAGQVGADVASIGAAVQLVTNGIKVGEYRPDDATDEVDIRVRYPESQRNLGQLDELRVQTAQGLVPISNFVKREPRPQVNSIERVDGIRVLRIEANTQDGVLASDKVNEIKNWLATQNIDSSVHVEFRGEDEQQRETFDFLGWAFGAALFMMALILITQFNSFYHSALILSAVIMSTVGVVLGLLITGRPFSAIMSGIGVVALAGIVVNNNIVLIDCFQELRKQGMELKEAIIRAGAQRLRPVFLTTFTTMIGLLPMALAVNIDFIQRTLVVGTPYAMVWVDLAVAVIFGLGFATMLTLIMTPCLLILPHAVRERFGHLAERLHLRRRRKFTPAE